MAASKKTVRDMARVILNYFDKNNPQDKVKVIGMLQDLANVQGNASFRDTILALKNKVESMM